MVWWRRSGSAKRRVLISAHLVMLGVISSGYTAESLRSRLPSLFPGEFPRPCSVHAPFSIACWNRWCFQLIRPFVCPHDLRQITRGPGGLVYLASRAPAGRSIEPRLTASSFSYRPLLTAREGTWKGLAAMEAPETTEGSVLVGAARRTLGICLLLVVVFLWTASNFLASVCALLLSTLHSIIHPARC